MLGKACRGAWSWFPLPSYLAGAGELAAGQQTAAVAVAHTDLHDPGAACAA